MQALTLSQPATAVRSKLFVPGSRPELFAKAARGEADALSFDLEDSITPARKSEARNAVATHLRTANPHPAKLCIVRVNAEPDLLAADIDAVVLPGLDILNLPKVECADDILRVVDLIEARERAAGITEPVGILPTIESPRGLRLAHSIATAHPRVIGLQLGFLDLAMQCGMDATNAAALHTVRLALRLAASEAGIAAFDGAYGNIRDTEGFRAQAEAARALGLDGKSCIHPSQVAVANEVFAPSRQLIHDALGIVRAAAEAEANGAGAVTLNGAMIDAPVAERARRVVQRARLFGLLSTEDET